jgi:hypothetical protein
MGIVEAVEELLLLDRGLGDAADAAEANLASVGRGEYDVRRLQGREVCEGARWREARLPPGEQMFQRDPERVAEKRGRGP